MMVMRDREIHTHHKASQGLWWMRNRAQRCGEDLHCLCVCMCMSFSEFQHTMTGSEPPREQVSLLPPPLFSSILLSDPHFLIYLSSLFSSPFPWAVFVLHSSILSSLLLVKTSTCFKQIKNYTYKLYCHDINACSPFRASDESSQAPMRSRYKPFICLNHLINNNTVWGTEQGSCVSSCVSTCSLLVCSLEHLPSEVQPATAFKGRQWSLIRCRLCQSLTWRCSPKPFSPLSLPQPHLDHTHLHIPPPPDLGQGAIQPNLLSQLPMGAREKIGHGHLCPRFMYHPAFEWVQCQILAGDTTIGIFHASPATGGERDPNRESMATPAGNTTGHWPPTG